MENRIEKADQLHLQGYNCAQAVACAYCDLLDLDEDTAFRLTEGFGGGMGMLQICGAISGAAVLAGQKNSAGVTKPGMSKGATTKLVRTIGKEFEAMNGSMICRALKGVDTGTPLRSCAGCIADACMLVEKHLLEE